MIDWKISLVVCIRRILSLISMDSSRLPCSPSISLTSDLPLSHLSLDVSYWPADLGLQIACWSGKRSNLHSSMPLIFPATLELLGIKKAHNLGEWLVLMLDEERTIVLDFFFFFPLPFLIWARASNLGPPLSLPVTVGATQPNPFYHVSVEECGLHKLSPMYLVLVRAEFWSPMRRVRSAVAVDCYPCCGDEFMNWAKRERKFKTSEFRSWVRGDRDLYALNYLLKGELDGIFNFYFLYLGGLVGIKIQECDYLINNQELEVVLLGCTVWRTFSFIHLCGVWLRWRRVQGWLLARGDDWRFLGLHRSGLNPTSILGSIELMLEPLPCNRNNNYYYYYCNESFFKDIYFIG